MRILHICPVGPFQGLGVPGPLAVALRLARGDQRAVVWTTQPLLLHQRVALSDHRLAETNIEVFRAIHSRRSLFWTSSPGLIYSLLVRRRSQDIVHLHLARNITSLLVGMLLVGRRRVFIAHTHGMIEPDRSLFKRVIDTYVVRRILHRARSVIALQDVEADWLSILGAKRERIIVVPNAIDAAKTSGAVPEFEARENLVLFIGHLRTRKNVLFFYDLALLLHNRHPQWKFRIAGPDGGDLPVLRQRLRQDDAMGRIQYLGVLTHQALMELSATAKVVVSPAIQEPFNLSVLDCMAVGTPAVISAGFHNKKLLLSCGAAIVCDLKLDDFASAVEEILVQRDLWVEMSASGLKLTREALSSESIREQIEEIYVSCHALVSKAN